MAGKEAVLAVLSISGTEEDHRALKAILGRSNWELHAVGSRREGSEFLRDHEVPVVICDCELPDGGWKDLLGDTAARDDGAALIVCSQAADERLWAEVLNLGGCDVLAKPFDGKEVLWSVGLALHEWNIRFTHAHPVLAS